MFRPTSGGYHVRCRRCATQRYTAAFSGPQGSATAHLQFFNEHVRPQPPRSLYSCNIPIGCYHERCHRANGRSDRPGRLRGSPFNHASVESFIQRITIPPKLPGFITLLMARLTKDIKLLGWIITLIEHHKDAGSHLLQARIRDMVRFAKPVLSSISSSISSMIPVVSMETPKTGCRVRLIVEIHPTSSTASLATRFPKSSTMSYARNLSIFSAPTTCQRSSAPQARSSSLLEIRMALWRTTRSDHILRIKLAAVRRRILAARIDLSRVSVVNSVFR